MPLFGRKKKEPTDEKIFREEIEQLKQAIEPQKPIPVLPEKMESQSPAIEKLMQAIKEESKQKVERKVEKLEAPKIPELSSSFDFEEEISEEKPEQEVKTTESEEAISFAPLFVKIDRYRQILNAMNYLKSMLVMVKNNFNVLNELEKLRNDNLKLVQETVDKIDKKIKTLDSEFLRPSGFIEQLPELHDVQGLQATIADLRSQVDQLKSDLKNIP